VEEFEGSGNMKQEEKSGEGEGLSLGDLRDWKKKRKRD
tara:strand:- start:686 stop:799 length:114 start_codon:yes stop_codon:yes gene_type:complete